MDSSDKTRSSGQALSAGEQQKLRHELADPQRSDEEIARSLDFSIVGSTVFRYRNSWGFPNATQARKLDYRPLNEQELKRVARLLEMMTLADAIALEAAGPTAQDGREVVGSGTKQMALYISSYRVTGVWFTRGDERWLISRALCRSVFPDGRKWVRRYIRIRSRSIRFAQNAAGRGEFASMSGEETISEVLQWIRQGEDVSQIQTAKRSYDVINEEPRLRLDIEQFRAELLTYFEI